MNSVQTDKDLLTRIKKDPQQFGTLYDLHYRTIFLYIFRRIGNYETARDLAAETFLKSYLNIQKFEWKETPLLAWLYRIAGNEIHMYVRKPSYKPDFISLSEDDFSWEKQLASNYEQEHQAAEALEKADEDFKLISACMLQLDEKYQEVLALRYFEEKSIAEIAIVTSKPEGTVKSLLARGLEKLRKLL